VNKQTNISVERRDVRDEVLVGGSSCSATVAGSAAVKEPAALRGSYDGYAGVR